MKKAISFLLVVTTLLVLAACGGGGGGGGDSTSTVTGQFVDSFVAGINYTCSSGTSNTTDVRGEFTCLKGDTVEFYLGQYLLGSCAAQATVTPYDLYPNNEAAAVRVAQLLQTLDENSDPSDGITITTNFSMLDDFAITPEGLAFETETAAAIGVELVSAAEAQTHMDESILINLFSGQTFYTTIYDSVGTLEQWVINDDVTQGTWTELVGGSDSGTVTIEVAGKALTFSDNEESETVTVVNVTDAYLEISPDKGVTTQRLYFDREAAEAYSQLKIPFAILDWRTLENGNDYGLGWIQLPQLLLSEDVADLKLLNSLGQTVLTSNDFTYDVSYGSVFIDCTSGTCSPGEIIEDKGYYTNYEAGFPVGTYTYVLETVGGEILEKTAVYKGETRMPVILSSSISPSWNEDGSLTVSWENPTTDTAWPLVKQVRIDVSSEDGASNMNVRFLEDYGTTITIPAAELSKTFTASELTSIRLRMQTRAIDENGYHYARGRSNWAHFSSLDIPVATLDWRTEESRSFGLGWITLPHSLSSEDVADLKVVNSGGQTVLTFNDFTYDVSYGTVLINCTSGTCASGEIMDEKGYYASMDLPADTYTYVLETVDGAILEKTNVYQGQISMPVIPSSSIVPSWNEDGSLTVSWENPTTDTAWPLVVQVRVDVSSADGASNLNVRFLENFGTSITIPAAELAKTFTESELASIRLRMQTRAIDENGCLYARGRSSWVAFETMPTEFTVDWLTGKTLYGVWFGATDLSYDSVGVEKMVFNSDQTATFTGLVNSSASGTMPYEITNGALHGAGDSSRLNTIICTTADYLLIEHTVDGVFDNYDRYYFDEGAALNYASNLTGQIPGFCNSVEPIDFSSLIAGTYQSHVEGDSLPTEFVLNGDNTGSWSYSAEGGSITWNVRNDGVLAISFDGGGFEEYTLTSGDTSSGTVYIYFSDESVANATWLKVE